MGTQEERNKLIEHDFRKRMETFNDYRLPKWSYLHELNAPHSYDENRKRNNPEGYIERYVKEPILSVIDPHYQKRFLGSLGGGGFHVLYTNKYDDIPDGEPYVWQMEPKKHDSLDDIVVIAKDYPGRPWSTSVYPRKEGPLQYYDPLIEKIAKRQNDSAPKEEVAIDENDSAPKEEVAIDENDSALKEELRRKRQEKIKENKGIQQILKDYGLYEGNIDGIIGSQSKAAIKDLQSRMGVSSDGIWGKNTENAYVDFEKNRIKKAEDSRAAADEVDTNESRENNYRKSMDNIIKSNVKYNGLHTKRYREEDTNNPTYQAINRFNKMNNSTIDKLNSKFSYKHGGTLNNNNNNNNMKYFKKYQEGGQMPKQVPQEEQIMQAVIEALSLGADPNEIVKMLVNEAGIDEQTAAQIVQEAMSSMEDGAGAYRNGGSIKRFVNNLKYPYFKSGGSMPSRKKVRKCKCGCPMKVVKNKKGGLVEVCSCGCKNK